MLRFFCFFPLLLLSIVMLCWHTPIAAHDTFYPHHREDFENIRRRRELRGTVIVSTIIFVGIVGTIIYVAMRKSSTDDKTDRIETKTIEERLEQATNNAAKAAQRVLNENKCIKEAAAIALTTYAENSGVVWRQRFHEQRRAESVPYQIRCKIGHDIVTLTINASVIQVKADHHFSKTGFGSQGTSKGVSATAVLKIRGEGEE